MTFSPAFARTILLGTLLAAGAAFAQAEATDPNAVMRQTTMKEIGGAMKVLGDMAGGKAAYDAPAAQAAKAKLIEAAGQIPTSFATEGAADPASEAKPEIWTSWDDFLKDAETLKTAAAAADVSSADTIKASMGAIGAACKDCHTEYRVMK
ncbi:c-type cytochrome [Xinfangfangia pollutisoli]|uniref:c-type cytochrome n=1 Tax=Xinfangfangia pollutisoli TaxID=2865960 RepID=UPI001CD66E3F|nr:cytochrome c [Xinfangfangia pollutisoli]